VRSTGKAVGRLGDLAGEDEDILFPFLHFFSEIRREIIC
jgi:hypothetical protein